jgi:DNA polymerase (family 10)
MTNKEIARLLSETSDLVELTGGNEYRARAYAGAARSIDDLDAPASQLAGDDALTDLDGIGDALAGDIRSILQSGSFGLRDELLGQLPKGLPELLRVQGLGTKKVRRLWQEADVTTLDQLEMIAESGRLANLNGFGEKTQQNVLENLRQLKRYRQQRRYRDALAQVDPVLRALRDASGVERVEVAGALRRKRETVERAVLLAQADAPESVRHALADHLESAEPRPEGDQVVFEGALPGRKDSALPLEIRLAPPERFGTAWWLLTGSEEHARAFREAHGEPDAHASESGVYDEAGLPFVEPELREGRGELKAAAEGRLPDLITEDDLRGSLHNHSTYSDGADTLRAMAEAARAMGLSYFGVCDHSRSLSIASGLSIDDVRRQQDEIRELNDEYNELDDSDFRVLSGIESDILKDGALDYPDDVLDSFDFVVASVHSGFNMTEDEATERVARAVRNPHTTILGHATGRLLLAREGYPLDHERVIAACAEAGTAIELNANPYRLDMDWRYLRFATEQDVLISINPDAHSTDELKYTRWGVAVARKAWLTAEDCLNAKLLDDFKNWLDEREA